MGPGNASLPAPPAFAVCHFSVVLEYKALSATKAACLFAWLGFRSPGTAYSSGKLLAGVGENHWSLLAIQTLAIAVTS